SQGSTWINIGLTPITENCYNCSREKQIPIFGIQYAENLLMIEPIDSAESKLKTIIKKSTEWGFEQLKDFAAKVMAELLKN
ncbi:MAG: hypothetical protein WBJ17_04965, partial [Natronincolaceae bacterium]